MSLDEDQYSVALATLLQGLIADVRHGESLDESRVAKALTDLVLIPVNELEHPREQPRLDAFFQLLTAWSGQRDSGFTAEFHAILDRILHLASPTTNLRGHLLALAVGCGDEEDLRRFAPRFLKYPPTDTWGAARPLIRLMRLGAPALTVFPDLLEGLTLPHAASAILDLANRLVRGHGVSPHPAAEKVADLIRMLAALVSVLEQSSTLPAASTVPHESSRATEIREAVSLAISLTDTLALIGDSRAIPVVQHFSQLPHRRLRVEGEAALTRLGDEGAGERLARLAEEPIVRLFVLHYMEELGLSDKVDEQFCSTTAIAEAELATFLARPESLGFPPSEFERIDSRTLHWPGYDEPRDCYLFRFHFGGPDGQGGTTDWSRIGIAGPLTLAFPVAMDHLDVPDLYAAFAGFQAEHDEIAEVRWPTSSPEIRARMEEFVARAVAVGLEEVEPVYWGSFFGDDFAILRARQGNRPGLAAIDAQDTRWLPLTGPDSPSLASVPLRPEDMLHIYKGRRLLSSFNPDF